MGMRSAATGRISGIAVVVLCFCAAVAAVLVGRSLGAGAAEPFPLEVGAPQLSAEGTIDGREAFVSVRVGLVNRSGEPVQIAKLGVSCACLQTQELATRLEAGARIEIVGQLDASGVPSAGKVGASIDVVLGGKFSGQSKRVKIELPSLPGLSVLAEENPEAPTTQLPLSPKNGALVATFMLRQAEMKALEFLEPRVAAADGLLVEALGEWSPAAKAGPFHFRERRYRISRPADGSDERTSARVEVADARNGRRVDLAATWDRVAGFRLEPRAVAIRPGRPGVLTLTSPVREPLNLEIQQPPKGLGISMSRPSDSCCVATIARDGAANAVASYQLDALVSIGRNTWRVPISVLVLPAPTRSEPAGESKERNP